jgi:hypothetical protein
MIRRIAMAATAGALALGGLAVAGGGSAYAGKVTITNATSALISCNITAKAKLSQKLKNNWVAADHAGDPDAAVVALPDTQFSSGITPDVTSKAKSTSCSGTASDAAGNVATIISLKLQLVPGTPAIDNPPVSPPGTCLGLLAGTSPEDVAATYSTSIKFKTLGAKLADAQVDGLGIAPSGVGFAISGGTVSGSLAGATSTTQAFIDGETLAAVTAAPATSAAPVPTSVLCEPSLKIKPATAKKAESVKFKKPKGLKSIVIGNDLFPPNEPSTITIVK